MILKINAHSPMWLKVANENTQKFKKILSNVTDESNIKQCSMFFQTNKYDGVMEKVLDNKELMERIRSDPVIHFQSSKDFKIAWKEKMRGKK